MGDPKSIKNHWKSILVPSECILAPNGHQNNEKVVSQDPECLKNGPPRPQKINKSVKPNKWNLLNRTANRETTDCWRGRRQGRSLRIYNFLEWACCEVPDMFSVDKKEHHSGGGWQMRRCSEHTAAKGNHFDGAMEQRRFTKQWRDWQRQMPRLQQKVHCEISQKFPQGERRSETRMIWTCRITLTV